MLRNFWYILLLTVLALGVVLSACAFQVPVAPAQQAAVAARAEVPDEAAVAAAVEDILAEYAASLAAGDVDRWIALWTNDGVQFLPGLPALVGKEALRADLEGFLDAFTIDMAIDIGEVEVAGDWAYATGLFTSTIIPKDGSEPILTDGKYMSIFQKQLDGSWKLHRDVSNSNVPPADQAEEATSVEDVEAVTAVINENWKQYASSLKSGDADLWISLWTENGVQLPPGSPPVVGKAQIGPAGTFAQKVTVRKRVQGR